jgi:proteic killer suppression protein
MTPPVIARRAAMQLVYGPTWHIREGALQPGIPSDVQMLARRRLRILENARSLDDLRAMPRIGLRLSASSPRPRREGCWYSVAVSRGWRLRFLWRRETPLHVDLVCVRGGCA